MAVLGPDIMSDVDLIGPGAFNPAKQAFFMYILQTSLTFSVYLFILMQGVRMFVSELTNAFKGSLLNCFRGHSQRLTLQLPMALVLQMRCFQDLPLV